MKSLLLTIVFALSTQATHAQLVNPTVVYQDSDIALHHTDVYYAPLFPPADTDTRGQLSCIAAELRDPDGKRETARYDPTPRGVHMWDSLPNTPWQRLFTAKDKPSGAHSFITAGDTTGTDSVIVSKNEDVDFRASGGIRLLPGFHAMPGSFFHAYIEPKWDTTVFSDEFDDTAKFGNQWIVMDSGAIGKGCLYNSNLGFDSDPNAHDGHALRLDFWIDTTGTCLCYDASGGGASQNCAFGYDTSKKHLNYMRATKIWSCPWPFAAKGDPVRTAYEHAPYGKYEIREKIPNIKHHTNFYAGDQSNEYNLYEIYNDDMTHTHPGISHNLTYGPFKGRFTKRTIASHDSAVFQSSDAHFTQWNVPYAIFINNFPYEVNLDLKPGYAPSDTLLVATATTQHEGGFPSILVADSNHWVSFYYVRPQHNVKYVSDPLPWSVDSTGRYLSYPGFDSAAYGYGKSGETLYFGKSYQPTAIYLFDSSLPPGSDPVQYNCRWDHLSGKLYLDRIDTAGPMPPWRGHTSVGFSYQTEEGPVYPVPAVPRDTDYNYHTYTMELLPHEAHFLIDGHVMRRFPDRLIPQNDIRYDYVTKYFRSPLHLGPAALEFDSTMAERTSLQTYGTDSTHGGWIVNGHPAAHHLVDYVKVWDLPSDCKMPDFPR